MGIKNIVAKPERQSKTPDKADIPKPVDPFIAYNKLWEEWFVVNKVFEDGTIGVTKLKFRTNDEYMDWILDGGPDRDLKDPAADYIVIRTWQRKV